MRLREFFERLPKDGWELDDASEIRHEPSGRCPVCAAANAGTIDWWRHYEDAGLDMEISRRVARCADNWSHMTPTEERIRRLLLKHCGLTENE